MNKTCARCEKTVYPTEELKCLDKTWHKGCFKCQECGMTLNMRTYKGYGKLPYCEAHVPKAKPTTMAETPELRRIAENTKIQSNVKYHADFEKSKGKFTQVADDPETLRMKANSRIISNVAYHGDLEKKAQMERQRTLNENGEVIDMPGTENYHQQIETYATEMLPPNAPPSLPQKNHYQAPSNHKQYPNPHDYNHLYRQPAPQKYEPQEYHYQNQNQQASYQPKYEEYNQQYMQYQQQNQKYQQSPKIGRIQDYDPLSDGPRAMPNTQRSSSTLIYNSTNDGAKQRGGHHNSQHAQQQQQQQQQLHQQLQQHQQQQHQQQQGRPIGRVTDMDPLASEQLVQRAQPLPSINTHINGKMYMAMYDYEANDSDEVSFREGDLISNVSPIDEGWMTGRVLRTGRTGMLPANYVQLAPM